MGSNEAFYSNLALTKLNNAYSDFLCARLDKLNEKALNDRARSIDEWSSGHPLLSRQAIPPSGIPVGKGGLVNVQICPLACCTFTPRPPATK